MDTTTHEHNEAELLEALNYINPAELDYTEWVKIGTALKTEGFSCEVWDDWSSKDPDRYNPKEIAMKWNGLKEDTVTGKTIFRYAIDRGYTATGHTPQHEAVTSYALQYDSMIDSRPAPVPADTSTADLQNYRTKCLKMEAESHGAEDYLKGRGISEQTISDFVGCIGYDPAYKGNRGPAVIFFCQGGYSSRIINPAGRNKSDNSTGADQKLIFNAAILSDQNEKKKDRAVFVTEGVINALSIETCGHDAIALNGCTNSRKLLDLLQDLNRDGKYNGRPFVIAFDNDRSGTTEGEKLLQELKASGYAAIAGWDMYGTANDANEVLQADCDGLTDQLYKRINPIMYEYTNKYSAASFREKFIDDCGKPGKPYSTNLKRLDDALGGGLFPGQLTTIGALTSAGKTALCLQIAETIAEAGNRVLYCTTEMSKTELIARGISRRMYAKVNHEADTIRRECGKKTDIHSFYITALEVRNSYKRKEWLPRGDGQQIVQDMKMKLLKEVETEYFEKIAPNLFILEGMESFGSADIEEIVKNHARFFGSVPFVVVDYMQQLAKPSDKLDQREALEQNMRRLKLIARDTGASILQISSMNNASQKDGLTVSNTSFKGTGEIAYTSSSTVILTEMEELTEKKVSKNDADSEEKTAYNNKIRSFNNAVADEKAKDHRVIALNFTKNRDAKRNAALYLRYIPAYNTFEDWEYSLSDDSVI